MLGGIGRSHRLLDLLGGGTSSVPHYKLKCSCSHTFIIRFRLSKVTVKHLTLWRKCWSKKTLHWKGELELRLVKWWKKWKMSSREKRTSTSTSWLVFMIPFKYSVGCVQWVWHYDLWRRLFRVFFFSVMFQHHPFDLFSLSFLVDMELIEKRLVVYCLSKDIWTSISSLLEADLWGNVGCCITLISHTLLLLCPIFFFVVSGAHQVSKSVYLRDS